MPTYKFKTVIGEDHKIDLPADVPTGKAEIHIITEHAQGASIQSLIRDIAIESKELRTKEDIDAELRRQRENWE